VRKGSRAELSAVRGITANLDLRATQRKRMPLIERVTESGQVFFLDCRSPRPYGSKKLVTLAWKCVPGVRHSPGRLVFSLTNVFGSVGCRPIEDAVAHPNKSVSEAQLAGAST
jgi:hypothetical protein